MRAPAIQVTGSFIGGGARVGNSSDLQNNFEFQDYVSLNHGAHTLRFGVRLRATAQDSISTQNFNGTFIFSGGTGPRLDTNDQPITNTSASLIPEPLQSIEQYRRTVVFQRLGLSAERIRELGGGATQFTISAGEPSLSVGQFDAGLFAGDDWRFRPNLTLSLGLRYEVQTNIGDWRDFGPRVAIAWAPGGRRGNHAKTVIRAGFGIFYDRFSLSNTLAAERYNGTIQRRYVVSNPDSFPSPPDMAASVSSSIVQRVSGRLRAPYLTQSIIGVERELPFKTTVALTNANSHGLHMLRSRDINAPLPGTWDPLTPRSGLYPSGAAGPIFLMESAGLYNQNQLLIKCKHESWIEAVFERDLCGQQGPQQHRWCKYIPRQSIRPAW